MIKAPTWEEVEAAAERYAETGEGAGQEAGPPRIYNAGVATSLGRTKDLRWDGRWYRVRPIPFYEAGELYRLQLELVEIHRRRHVRKQEAEGELVLAIDLEAEREDSLRGESIMREATAVMNRLVRPKGARRIAWALGIGRRPFADATMEEVQRMMDFFSTSRTASRGGVSSPTVFGAGAQG